MTKKLFIVKEMVQRTNNLFLSLYGLFFIYYATNIFFYNLNLLIVRRSFNLKLLKIICVGIRS